MKTFDLTLMDTLIYLAYEYRVVAIREDEFEVKRAAPGSNILAPLRLVIKKEDYEMDTYRMRKANTAPVICYVDKRLKK